MPPTAVPTIVNVIRVLRYFTWEVKEFWGNFLRIVGAQAQIFSMSPLGNEDIVRKKAHFCIMAYLQEKDSTN